ncbi:MAG TPA: OmpA family protein [Chitinophagaceae bacterium]|nr:OmpA family protein [Chitinophagaceae bacterium]
MKRIFSLLFFFSISIFTYAQIGQKIKDKVKQRTDEKVDKAIDDELDKAEEGLKKKTKTKTETENGKTKTKTKTEDEDGDKTKTKTESDNNSPAATASFASYSKFDFVPGEKTIFFDDFSQDNIGDFPVKWNTNGKGEVVTNNRYPGKWLKMRNGTTYLPEISSNKLPDNYTIEYDMVAGGEDRQGNFNLQITSLGNKKEVPGASDPSDNPGIFLSAQLLPNGTIRYLNRSAISGQGYGDATTDIEDKTLTGKPSEKFHVSIAVNKQRFRYYVNEVKVLDLPRILPEANYNAIIFRTWAWEEDHPMDMFLSNFRYAEGTTDVRSKLMTEGKLVTRGITFDVNSDKIKAESFGTIKEIAQVLKDNAAVKVKIIGHTDNDGSAAANLELSKKRSASVKNALSKDFGIDAARIQTDGKGASEPASPNTTPEGKANNRRVEFIKM